MSNDQSQAVWEEAVFTVALMLTCIVFFVTAAAAAIHEETGLTSRSLPMTISATISVYCAVKAISLLRSANNYQFHLIRVDGITVKIILPLSVTMALYVPLVVGFSYVIGTAMVLMIVLWVFGVRDLVFNFAMSVAVGIVADYVFVDTLGMFMPTGWMIEFVQEQLWS